ncbi:MAG: hypothetical protein HC836_49395 [Richelia sp. RM2_1_2]|nr:hypothetical protein [Richelia sp. SM2_1_7]NJM24123.1 hypothetical protein [Richelia sp. SM1_7_0]NJN13932.1 hypothetical protein [Richelia sp. RM1_1_1]NJO31696.1 hypothetical protein [Richelia sp. SL_2_1]NJO65810.1 hypothetical protein [Richelia sp. RM2_1_2]
MDKSILQDRFKKLGLTAYKLAQEVSIVRANIFGEEKKKAASLVTSVSKVIENPNTSSFKNVEAAIRAMNGELIVRWKNVESVVVGHEEIEL